MINFQQAHNQLDQMRNLINLAEQVLVEAEAGVRLDNPDVEQEAFDKLQDIFMDFAEHQQPILGFSFGDKHSKFHVHMNVLYTESENEPR